MNGCILTIKKKLIMKKTELRMQRVTLYLKYFFEIKKMKKRMQRNANKTLKLSSSYNVLLSDLNLYEMFANMGIVTK